MQKATPLMMSAALVYRWADDLTFTARVVADYEVSINEPRNAEFTAFLGLECGGKVILVCDTICI